MEPKPGDIVLAVTAKGERIPARVVEGPHMDGDWHVVTLCSPDDWATFESGKAPDYWDEWRYDWPADALEWPPK